MAVWICRDCTAAYSVGAPKCPHCGSTDRIEEGEQNMPKITVQGGPSIAGVTGAWGDEPETDEASEQDAEGGEESSPGSSSPTSTEKPPTSPETSGTAPSKRVRKTASPSAKARTDSSTAPSTDGAPTGPSSKTAADES